MAGSLSNAEVRRYHDQGFLFPLRVMSEEEAKACRARFEAREPEIMARGGRKRDLRNNLHYLLPEVAALVRSPVLVDIAESVLGPDLLVWGCDGFIKEPGSPDYISWHQDLTYWGLDQQDEITLWLALSPATVESGCMRFLPGSHKQAIVPHRDTYAEDNLLSRGQEIAVEVDEKQAVPVVLAPGEVSLHHGRMFHASAPNGSQDRRIGLAVRYIAPHMRQTNTKKDFAMLVRGEDRFGHFELVEPPAGPLDDALLQRVAEIAAVQSEIFYEES